MCQLQLKFRLNDNEIITINEPVDSDGSEHLFKVTNDDEYTVGYIKKLLNNGFISISSPLEEIFRLGDDGSETCIYSVRNPEQEMEESYEPHDSGQTGGTDSYQIYFDSSQATTSSHELWSYDAVLALIESMTTHYEDLSHPKKKKHVFSNIANDLLSKKFSYTEKACTNKWRSLLRSYKTTKDKKNTTGQGATRFMFFELMDELLGNKPSISSGKTLESSDTPSNMPTTKECNELTETDDTTDLESSKSDENPSKKRKRVSNSERKELAKQKRHEERMTLEAEKLKVEEKKVALLQKFIEKL